MEVNEKRKVVVERIKESKGYNKTMDDLKSSIVGFTDKVTNLLDATGDITPEIREYLGNSYNVRGQIRDLMQIKGKDVTSGKELQEVLYEEFRKIGELNAPAMSQSKMIAMLKEYNYLVSNMPQLMKSITNRVTDILSPDNFSKMSINYSIINNDSSLTIAEIETIAEERKIGLEVQDSLIDGYVLGVRYAYVFPTGFVADNIKQRMNITEMSVKDIDKTDAKVKKTGGISLFGEVFNGTKFFKDKKDKVEPSDTDDYILFGETENGMGEFVRKDDFRDELKDLLNEKTEYNQLYGEALGFTSTKEADKTQGMYSNIPIIEEAKEFIYAQYQDMLYGESFLAKRQNFNGCFVGTLEADRTIPIIIDKEIIGAYYIEETLESEQAGVGGGLGNNINSTALRDNALDPGMVNNMVKQQIYDNVYDVIRKNMSNKFLKSNSHILEAIDSVVKNSTMGKSTANTRVKFIPREYIVPFYTKKDGRGYPVSAIHKARVPAHMWILLAQSGLHNKLYNNKDKTIAYVKTGLGTQLDRMAVKASKNMRTVYPLPSEIYNLQKTHKAMLEGDKLMAPVSKDGDKGIEFDRLEGMKEEINWTLMETMEEIATSMVGVHSSLMSANNKEDLATPLLSLDGRNVREAIVEQAAANDCISEYITKIVRCVKGDPSIEIKAKLPAPQALSDKIFEDNIERIERRIDKIISFKYGENWADNKEAVFVRTRLLEEETSSMVDHKKIEALVEEFNADIEDNGKDDDEGDDY